ncbi:hypothetical protein QBC44DRAFT_386927 [Cladorrhinum sp. PSN332]|nr:hypothetical protein QBC44DRAFT_386927 [Cladorrhinum sp. PSN332]
MLASSYRHGQQNNNTRLNEKLQLGLTCVQMATGSWRDLTNQVNYHNHHGGNVGTPAVECRRTACENTSGTYLCSEHDNVVDIPARDVADKIDKILNGCCGSSSGKSGNWFEPTYSVWIGYANCN